jgi:hypothetical protein
MNVTYKNFTMYPVPYALDRFDVFQTIKRTATQDLKSGVKEGEMYETEEDVAFGLTLESAIQKIILLTLAEKEGTTDLKGYLKAYKEERIELEKLLKL